MDILDDTQADELRAALARAINANAKTLEQLHKEHGQVWDTAQLRDEFDVQSFAAPFVVVYRKSDQKLGTLMFQHQPRYYYKFETD